MWSTCQKMKGVHSLSQTIRLGPLSFLPVSSHRSKWWAHAVLLSYFILFPVSLTILTSQLEIKKILTRIKLISGVCLIISSDILKFSKCFPISHFAWAQPKPLKWIFCTPYRKRLIPSSRDLPDPGIELGSPALQVDSLPTELPGKPLLVYPDFQNVFFTMEHNLFFRDIHSDQNWQRECFC